MTVIDQEIIAFGIVLIALLWIGWRIFRGHFAGPLADIFLRFGRVKYAMWLRRKRGSKTGCSGCSSTKV